MADSDSGCVSASADDKARGASWRDHLKIHPAAELFPLMSEPELRELGEDIKANGLVSSIVLYEGKLLDGRNRLDAMELVGIKFRIEEDKYKLSRLRACDGSGVFKGLADLVEHCNGDPYDRVLSANLHRRHLTGEQKRELIAKVLKAKPEASNRQIAKQIKVDHKTASKIRKKMESTGEIPQLDKTTGADGKARKRRIGKKEKEFHERAAARKAKMQADWLADHPGRTVGDFVIAGSCGATPEEEAAFRAWLAKRRAKMQADWLADHPGRTVEDFEIAGSCIATPEAFRAWLATPYAVGDTCIVEAESRATGGAEISIDQRRAEMARLDQPAEEPVDEVDRRVSCVTNTILRHVDRLSRSDAKRFFASLRDRLDDAEREVLQEAATGEAAE